MACKRKIGSLTSHGLWIANSGLRAELCLRSSEHSFTLILAGVAEITPALADALFIATHGDIEFNMQDDVAFLEFERKAISLRKAILAAIRVVRVESETANTIAKINADLLGVARG